MSQYRCAVCGSPNVKRIDISEGFSYKKALVGTAVLGTIGTVAGINGKKATAFECPDCGNTSVLPMNDTTKFMIDTYLPIAPEVFLQKNQDLVHRYSYVSKEIEQILSRDNQFQSTPARKEKYANPLNLSESEVRDAAKKWASISNYSMPSIEFTAESGKLVIHDTSPNTKSIDKYVEGIASVRIITYGLPNFPYLVMENDYSGSGLAKFNLVTAVIYNLLLEHGSMSLKEIYYFVKSDETLSRCFDALSVGQMRPIPNIIGGTIEPEWKTWCKNYGLYNPALSYMFKGLSLRNNGDTPIYPKWMVINNSLYTIGPSAEEQFKFDYPDINNKLTTLEQSISQIKHDIAELNENKKSPTEQKLQGDIDSKENEIASLDNSIISLKKKLFGRKKALLEAEEYQNRIATIKSEIDSLQIQLEEEQKKQDRVRVDTMKEKKHTLDTFLSEKNDIESFISAELKKYSDYICVLGPDRVLEFVAAK